MSKFNYKIMTPGGQIKKGTTSAASGEELTRELEKNGSFVVALKPAGKSSFAVQLPSWGKSMDRKEFYTFNQELSVLLRAGLSIVAALEAVAEKGKKTFFGDLLERVRLDISRGESISSAFGKYPQVVSPLYLSFLKAGEKSGDIPESLSRYLDYMKRSEKIRQKIITAAIYPVILIVVSAFVLSFLLVFVVPSITGAFVEAGAKLPFLTKMLLDLSDFLKSNILSMAIAGAVMFIVFFLLLKTQKFSYLMDRWSLSMPLTGTLNVYYATCRFARTLSTVLKSGSTLIDALEISSGVLSNAYLITQIEKTMKELEQGEGFAQSLAMTGVFPGLALRMIAAGEKGGSLDKVLDDVANFYDDEVEAGLTLLTSAIEPALMVIMGVLVGLIVLALYMPIFQMAGAVG